MKIFVTGAGGQLGSDLMRELLARGHDAVGSDIRPAAPAGLSPERYVSMDITDRAQVRQVLTAQRPDGVIHCAAWTDVDGAEAPDNADLVRAINSSGTEHIAGICRELGCKMLYISTDYVFSGQDTEPWLPDCRDFAPLNFYGRTKLEGEKAVSELLERFFIVRVAWVFGLHGKNFVKSIRSAARTHDTLRVVSDQIGTPTYAPDLARLLADIIETDKYGYFHATNEGDYISWYDFACEICRQSGLSTRVIPVSTEEYGASVANRPRNSRLDRAKLRAEGFEPLPHWKDALRRYLTELEREANAE